MGWCHQLYQWLCAAAARLYNFCFGRTVTLKGGLVVDVGRKLAEGGFANVYEGKARGEAVVVKELFGLDDEGARKFAEITTHHVGDPFAVVLDGKVITAPVIRSPITAGRGQISGGFDAREAGDLALLLRAGALPAPLEVVEQRTVGPDLGGDQIRMGVTTGLIGAALVLAISPQRR